MAGRVRVRDLNTGEEAEFDFDEFVYDNTYWREQDEVAEYEALQVGIPTMIGGGAAPLIEVTRLA